MMYVVLFYMQPPVTYSSLQHISFFSNIFKNDAQMDALKPSIIRNDIEQTIEVDGFNLQVTSVRYTNRIRESAKVCFLPYSHNRD